METPKNAWLCTVCGYIHHGAEPPDACPVCGATSDLFELQEAEEETAASEETALPAASQWRCLNCEYVHKGDTPPEDCLVCGSPRDRFEALAEAPSPSGEGDAARVVIVGAGIAGISAAEAVRNNSDEAQVLVLAKENALPYYRLNLTRYLAGEIKQGNLQLKSDAWFEAQNIQIRTGCEVCSVDREQKALTLRDGEEIPYDRLILAMGSHPFIPPFPGATRENVTALRTVSDVEFILAQASESRRCAVIGGGLLGLEAAGALAKRGLEVTLLEGHGWLLPRQLNETAARYLEAKVEKVGIDLRNQVRVKELVGEERVRAVLLEDGGTIDTDLVIIATGVRPNSYIARMSGLEVNRGIIVDDHLRTSDDSIFAAGDVAEHRGVFYGTWGPSQFQGTMAGMNAVGVPTEFIGVPRSNMLKVLGYDLFSIGQVKPEDASYWEIKGEIGDSYYTFIFRDSRMVSCILMGDTRLSPAVKRLVEQREDCAELLAAKPTVEDVIAFLKG